MLWKKKKKDFFIKSYNQNTFTRNTIRPRIFLFPIYASCLIICIYFHFLKFSSFVLINIFLSFFIFPFCYILFFFFFFFFLSFLFLFFFLLKKNLLIGLMVAVTHREFIGSEIVTYCVIYYLMTFIELRN